MTNLLKNKKGQLGGIGLIIQSIGLILPLLLVYFTTKTALATVFTSGSAIFWIVLAFIVIMVFRRR